MPVDNTEFFRGVDDGLKGAPGAVVQNMSSPKPPDMFVHNMVGEPLAKQSGLQDWAKSVVDGASNLKSNIEDKAVNYISNTDFVTKLRNKVTQDAMHNALGSTGTFLKSHGAPILTGLGGLAGGYLLHSLLNGQTDQQAQQPQQAPTTPTRRFAFDKPPITA
jgi:hypothetical protein